MSAPAQKEESKPAGICLPTTEMSDDWMDDGEAMGSIESDEEEPEAAAAPSKKAAEVNNGDAMDANGNVPETNGITPETNGIIPVTNGDAPEAEAKSAATTNSDDVIAAAAAKKTKTVEGIVAKLKNDTKLSDSDKIDTLCLLVQRIIEENNHLKSEIVVVGDQCEKQREAKEAIKTLNQAYKKQIELVREESKLRMEEEIAKRQAGMGGYTETMTDLSALLSTHTEQNLRLRDQNTVMAERMTGLVGETEKRDKLVASMQEEASLQITLLQHQVQKAHIEKAEIKADMTKDRLELSQELLLERERSRNLDDTVKLLKEQGELYQAQMEELQAGAGNSTKSFQHFKTQIEKLTQSMGQLEKDTSHWRQKYEVSSSQVKKMNTSSMEREGEVAALRKKLESMVKLNKTLNAERTALQEKCKQQDA